MFGLSASSEGARQALRALANSIATDTERALDSALSLAQRFARTSTAFQSHSGRLTNSVGPAKSGRFDGQLVANASYAMWVENGTGPHVIQPRKGSVLAFQSNGSTIFARKVNHPGTKATHFMENAVNYAAPFLQRDLEAMARRASYAL